MSPGSLQRHPEWFWSKCLSHDNWASRTKDRRCGNTPADLVGRPSGNGAGNKRGAGNKPDTTNKKTQQERAATQEKQIASLRAEISKLRARGGSYRDVVVGDAGATIKDEPIETANEFNKKLQGMEANLRKQRDEFKPPPEMVSFLRAQIDDERRRRQKGKNAVQKA